MLFDVQFPVLVILEQQMSRIIFSSICDSKGVEREEFKEVSLPNSKKHLPGKKYAIAII